MHRPTLEKFSPSTPYRDVFFTILFLAHIVGVIVLLGVGLKMDPPSSADQQQVFISFSKRDTVFFSACSYEL